MKDITLVSLTGAALLLTLASLSLSAQAASQQPGVDFQFSAKSDGEFDLQVNAVLSPGRTLEEAREILLDADSMKEVSQVIIDASTEQKSATESTLYSEWKRTFGPVSVERQIVADCTESQDSNSWTMSCPLRVERDDSDPNDKGQTGSLFTHGSTVTFCQQTPSDSSVRCRIESTGQTKKQGFFPLRLSAAHMALSGASVNLRDESLHLTLASSGESIQSLMNSDVRSSLEAFSQALWDEASPQIDRIPSGQTLHVSGDARVGVSSMQVKLQ